LLLNFVSQPLVVLAYNGARALGITPKKILLL
jgi:hypothetical protein